MAGVGRFLSFSGSLYKPWLKFRVCAETPRSGLANHHTLALACTGKTGQFRTSGYLGNQYKRTFNDLP
jgi:hypothetical protein